MVVTMPAGRTLLANATYSFTGGSPPPVVVSQAADGKSVTLLVAPGTDAPLVIKGVATDYAPTAGLTLSTSQVVTATTTSDFVGTDDYTTAPEIILPAVDGTVSFYDIPSAVDMFYKFVLPDSTTLKMTVEWQAASGDIDGITYGSTGNFLGYFGAGTSSNPEVAVHSFGPGTYFFGPEIYLGSPGTWYKVSFKVLSKP